MAELNTSISEFMSLSDEELKLFIYKKERECPVCSNNFQDRIIRSTKLKVKTVHSNLRPEYEKIEPLFYDVVLCENCGYATCRRDFDKISETRVKWVSEKITPNYKAYNYPDTITLPMAIERYKMALANAMVMQCRDSKLAYLTMKLSWFYEMKKDKKNELMFSKASYKYFEKARITEDFPLEGLEEPTINYVTAYMAKELRQYGQSLKLLSYILTSKSVSESLKDRARDLKVEVIALQKTAY